MPQNHAASQSCKSVFVRPPSLGNAGHESALQLNPMQPRRLLTNSVVFPRPLWTALLEVLHGTSLRRLRTKVEYRRACADQGGQRHQGHCCCGARLLVTFGKRVDMDRGIDSVPHSCSGCPEFKPETCSALRSVLLAKSVKRAKR